MKRFFQDRWSELTSSEAKLWHLVVAALITVFINYQIDELKSSNERRDKVRTEEVERFLRASTEFDIFAAHYASSIMEDKLVDKKVYLNLIENLNEQYSSLQTAKIYLPVTEQKVVSDYANALEKFRNILPTATDVLSMNGYWEAASETLKTRRELITDLRKAVEIDFAYPEG